MTPQEEELVLELHKKWGNRYFDLVFMRKKAQNKKRGTASPATSSSNCASSVSNNPTTDTLPMQDATGESFYDTGGPGKRCSMEDIWGDIVSSEENAITPAAGSYPSFEYAYPQIASPTWELDTGNLWKMDEEDGKIFESLTNQFYSSYENGGVPFSG